MGRIRLAICIEEEEYRRRLVNCMMNHYRERFELHVFTKTEELGIADSDSFHAILLGQWNEDTIRLLEKEQGKIIYLWEDGEITGDMKQNILFVDKYQNVKKLVDNITSLTGIGECSVTGGPKIKKCRWIGIYSLTEGELQLPFVMTLCSILGEQQRVLLVDLQENSGLMETAEERGKAGMEELLAMAETEEENVSRIVSAIGHIHQWDYIYPVGNSECLCEADGAVYEKMLELLERQMDYDVILLNLGTRFQGFFKILNQCQQIFLLRNGNSSRIWREQALMSEIKQKGLSELKERIFRVDLPEVPVAYHSCESIAEQWKWDSFGDLLRKLVRMETYGG